MVLGHGKYRGWDLRDVPRDYVEWLRNNNGEIIGALEVEIQRRNSVGAAEASSSEAAGQATVQCDESGGQDPTFLNFGKHRGENLKVVPKEYLEWLLIRNRETVAAVEAEVGRRELEAENIINSGFQAVPNRVPKQMEVLRAKMPEVKKCPPGVAKNSDYNPTWFGGAIDLNGIPRDVGLAKRLARAEFHLWESAVLDVVLNCAGTIAQKDLETAVMKMGVRRWRIGRTAQILAEHGRIARKKIGKQWHYSNLDCRYPWPIGARHVE